MKTRLLPFVFGALALLQPAPVLQAGTTLGDALDATNLVWETGGTTNVGWVYEQDVSGGGASAPRPTFAPGDSRGCIPNFHL